MHMTTSKPLFSFIPKKTIEQQPNPRHHHKSVLEVQYEIPDDQFFGQGNQVKQINQEIKQQVRQMLRNLPKLQQGQRLPYQDVVFKNLQKIFKDRRKSLPNSIMKPQKQPKDKLTGNQRHRVSIQIPLESLKNQFEIEEKYYHNSDKNFSYDMKIVIKKVQSRPSAREHPLKKYLTGRLSEYNL